MTDLAPLPRHAAIGKNQTDSLDNLGTPKALSDDLVDRIAKEVAALVSDHIETMYPKAAEAVACNSCKRSIKVVVLNSVSSAVRAAEKGTAEQWIKESAARRRSFRSRWNVAKSAQTATTDKGTTQ